MNFEEMAATAKSNAATMREMIVARKRQELQGMDNETLQLVADLDGDSLRREIAREEIENRRNAIDDRQDVSFDDEFSS